MSAPLTNATLQKTIEDIKNDLESLIIDEDALLQKIEQAVQQFPSQSSLWYIFTSLYLLRIGKLGQAFASLKKAHGKDPNHAEILKVLSIVAAKLGLSDEALYYIKLSTTTHEPNEDILPNWLPEFQDAFLEKDESAYIEYLRYLIDRGYYVRAFEVCQDLLMAYQASAEILALSMQISILVNRPYAAIDLVKKLIDYFQGNVVSTECLIIADLFIGLGQQKNAQIWFDEGKKKFFPENFTPHERRLLYQHDPLWQEMKMHYQLSNHHDRQKYEKNYCKNLTLENHSHQDYKRKKFIKLGILTRPNSYQNMGRFEYIMRKLALFKNTNLQIVLYIDRPEHIGDMGRFKSIIRDTIYTDEIDSQTLSVIIKNENVDILLDINDHAAPTRPDLICTKPALLNVLFAGDAQTAGLWGYDAVLGDQYIYPLPVRKSLDSGEYIVEKFEGKASILRMRESLIQYINYMDDDQVPTPKKENFALGIYCHRRALDEEKILFLRKILEQIPQTILIFEKDILGGEEVFQELLETIAAGNPQLEERLIMPTQIVPLDLFVSYPDIMINITPSNIQLTHSAIKNGKICLCHIGHSATQRIDASIILQLSEEFDGKMIFDNWDDYLQAIKNFAENPDTCKHVEGMIAKYNAGNIKDWPKKAVIIYDDFSYILSKFYSQGKT